MRHFFIFLVIFALIALAIYCTNHHAPEIENDIRSRIGVNLQSNDVDFISAHIEGRDVTLKGLARNNAEHKKIINLTSNIWGVNKVDDKINIKKIAPKIAKNHNFKLRFKDNKITLSGNINSIEEKDKILKNITKQFSKNNVVDNLTINKDTPQDWNKIINNNILPNLQHFSGAEFNLISKTLYLFGIVKSIDAKNNIINKLKANLDTDYKIIDNIKVLQSTKKPIFTKPSTKITPDPKETTQQHSSSQCQKEFQDILTKGKIFFDSARSTINSQSNKVLELLIGAAKKCPNLKIRIAGHTDSTGNQQNNLELSKDRAMSVAQSLIKGGIKAELLTVVGYGDLKPIASNKTATGKAKNRRIEFIVLNGKQSN